MALRHVNELEREADLLHKAVVAVDCGTYDEMEIAVRAAKKADSPIILMYYPGGMSARMFRVIAEELSERYGHDIGIILDHGPDYETVCDCIKAGFPSVMIDCSDKPFEENVRLVSEVTRTAHLFGVDVEAELGHVGSAGNENDYKDNSLFAKPEEVVEFIERTGCDSLAVHIGSAHGIYKSTPRLDLGLLDRINAVTQIPLVLHGGSGIPTEQVRAAIKRGINKTNYGTEFDIRYMKALAEVYAAPDGERYSFEYAPDLYEKVEGYILSLLEQGWYPDEAPGKFELEAVKKGTERTVRI